MPKVQKLPRRTKSSKAEIVFPVGRVHRKLKKGRYADKIGVGAAVYLASVLEYLAAELSELAGNCCAQYKRKFITPRHIYLAVQNDDELSVLLDGVTFPNGGVVPHIHSVLQAKRISKKKKSV